MARDDIPKQIRGNGIDEEHLASMYMHWNPKLPKKRNRWKFLRFEEQTLFSEKLKRTVFTNVYVFVVRSESGTRSVRLPLVPLELKKHRVFYAKDLQGHFNPILEITLNRMGTKIVSIAQVRSVESGRKIHSLTGIMLLDDNGNTWDD